ncbi:MAG: magnesium transporter [Candidatus Latescibacterota bacterium]|jgi:magnesium transporter
MIRIFSYSRSSTRMETPSIAELPQHLEDEDRIIWADLEDPDDEEMGVLGGLFGFHVLAAEDCIQGGYLPMLDLYDTYAFFVVHAIDIAEMDQHIQTIEVGCFLGARFLVTHHAKQVKGIFDARGKVAQNPGALLNAPDWLLHNIIDALTDHYGPAIDLLKSRIGNTNNNPAKIEKLNIEIATLLQIGKLQQSVLTRLAQDPLPYIQEARRIYYQNIQTHMVRSVQFLQSCASHLAAHQTASLVQANNQQVQKIRAVTAIITTFATAIFLTVLLKPEVRNLIYLSDKTWAIISTLIIILVSGGIAGLFKFKKWF